MLSVLEANVIINLLYKLYFGTFFKRKPPLTRREKYLAFEASFSHKRSFRRILTEIRHFCECIERTCYWGWKMRYAYDWDNSSFYRMIEYKLDRMIPTFQKDNLHSYPKNFIRRMQYIRLLAQRLAEGDFSRNTDRHEDIWGCKKMLVCPSKNGVTSQLVFLNPIDVNTKNEQFYKKSWTDAVKADYEDEVATRKLFFNLISKYIPKWWN